MAPTSGAEARTPPLLNEITAPMTPLLPSSSRLSKQRWFSTYQVSHRVVPHYALGRGVWLALRRVCIIPWATWG